MFSIYSSLYNLSSFDINYKFILKNWLKFIGNKGEIVITINDPELNTQNDAKFQEFLEFVDEKSIKLIYTKIPFSKNTFDGEIKDAALQNCNDKYPLKIQLDMDEIFPNPEGDRWEWDQVGDKLLNSNYEAVFVPSIDLYAHKETIRKNHPIGIKWRIHKRGLKRGVWRAAKLENGLFNTAKSDSCELLDAFDNLVPTISITPPQYLKPEYAHNLSNYIFTYHLGYLNLSRRANLNKNWWSEKWSDRSGKQENVTTDIYDLTNESIIPHNLPIYEE